MWASYIDNRRQRGSNAPVVDPQYNNNAMNTIKKHNKQCYDSLNAPFLQYQHFLFP